MTRKGAITSLRWPLILLCLWSLTVPAQSQTAPGDAGTTGNEPGFTWVTRPSTLPVDVFYPLAANSQEVVGRVALTCTPRVDQRVDCSVARETPEGWGFGAAALGLSHSFRIRPNMRDGQIIGSPHASVNLSFAPYPNGAMAPTDRLDLPLWENAPNPDTVRAAWPEGAAHPNIRGRAVLSCTVNADRSLSCSAAHESQPGLGLSRAALALVAQFRVAESDAAFAERHRTQPFLLPVNFGFGPLYEPLNRFTAGDTPTRFPDPPAIIVRAVYPPAALAAHLSGSADIMCTVQQDQHSNCTISSETPAGVGFGNAALQLANAAMASMVSDASLPGDQLALHVPFDWQADGDANATAPH